MMKKVLTLVVLLVIAGVAANYLMKGGLPFMGSLSEEEQEINRLRTELRAAERDYRQAGRAAGLSGMDTTAEATAALREVDRIADELAALKGELSSDAAKVAMRNLEEEIEDFRRELR
jgi:hypothetical protein